MTEQQLDRDVQVRIHNLEQLLTSPGWAEVVVDLRQSMEEHQQAIMRLGVRILAEPKIVLWVAETIAAYQAFEKVLVLPEGLIERLREEITPEEAESRD